MHGDILGSYAYGFWNVVIANVLFFLIFAVGFLQPKKKYEWRSMGALTGFLLALFTEMYGLPLSVYFLTSLLGDSYPVISPFAHSSGHLLLVLFGLSQSARAMVTLHLVSNGLIILGGIIVFLGWVKIHRANEGVLVDRGIYSLVRHPQYSGLFITTVGFLIQWPSLLMLIMWPILMYAYYRLAKREEGRLLDEFGEEFLRYRSRVPAFVPRFKRMKHAVGDSRTQPEITSSDEPEATEGFPAHSAKS